MLLVLWLSVVDSTVQPWVRDGFPESDKNPPSCPPPSLPSGPHERDKQGCLTLTPSRWSLTTSQGNLAHMGGRRHVVESQLLETSQAGHQKLQSTLSAVQLPVQGGCAA